ncbi:Cholesterol dehydrogenase [Dermatophilus congolensis]|uniref:Cholesterol dehydrogenase n=1 Tax=Dermatophilus congolensis TaxID=1863 RepID=A0A239V5P8_9MICO|nr:NAD-dependent epimerase/dehydratase family protein [Dermatophilus congolensis]SNV17510.1 Cholesterol dehydrogenase [Dermatophilus congolensis]
MKVLVTGASGMLGGGVAEALMQRGDEVTVLQRRVSNIPGVREVLGDITVPGDVDRAMAGQEAVVHLAAKVNITGRWEEYLRINAGGTLNMLDAARRHGICRFVHTSSPSVAHAGTSIVGEGAGPASPEHARGNYARSKAISERMALEEDLRSQQAGSGPAVVVLRPHIVWGPRDTQLVARVIRRAQAGRLPVVGNGAALIDTLYIDNAVDAFVAAVDRCIDVRGESFVVTNGEPRPVSEIFVSWARAGGVDPAPKVLPKRPALWVGSAVDVVTGLRERFGVLNEADPPLTRFLVEQLSTAHWFDQRRTQQALRWTPKVSLDEGFARVAEYYCR